MHSVIALSDGQLNFVDDEEIIYQSADASKIYVSTHSRFRLLSLLAQIGHGLVPFHDPNG